MDDLDRLDEVYFAARPWGRRLTRWLKRESQRRPWSFLVDNARVAALLLRGGRAALRMVVNIPAASLISFFQDGRYLNAYEREVQMGADRGVSPRRKRVDGQIFAGESAAEFYFGAVALGGCGVRFYGEYCMVLDEAAVAADEWLMDRNSWDIESPPLSHIDDRGELVARLRGTWAEDVEAMTRLKVLPHLVAAPRLVTTGVISDALLHDESFIEVHKRHSFCPEDLHEIRSSPQDAAVEGHIVEKQRRGRLPTPEEMVWLGYRMVVEELLAAHRVPHRIVTTTGRPGR